MRIPAAILSLAAALMAASARAETPAELTDRLLSAGKLAEAESSLAKVLAEHPDDAEARFGLGATRFLHAVERMSQSFYRYGLHDAPMIFEFPIPLNSRPEPIRYTDLRNVIQAMVDDLAKAESTLAPMGDREVKLPLHLGRIRMDLNGDGTAGEDERLWKVFVWIAGTGDLATPEQARAFVVAFDRADVAWVRGYSHLLMALAEAYLALDGEELFNVSAHLFFLKAITPYPTIVAAAVPDPQARGDDDSIMDMIAMIHAVHLPVKEPARMQAALKHLEAMIALSRETWKRILAEKDDDREWIPNPHQASSIPGGAVKGNMVEGWMTFLDEADALLQGKKLLPFWRKGEKRGVNLRRVFTEPRAFDLVYWVQGTAALPYLENGEKTRPETWQGLKQLFGGGFIGFADWFN